jgi:hypothetical protein
LLIDRHRHKKPLLFRIVNHTWHRGPAYTEGPRLIEAATVAADGEAINVHIPLTFRKRGGRNWW